MQSMKGFEEGVEFLPVNSTKQVEKRGRRRWVLLAALLLGLLLLALVVGLLVWHFQRECGGHPRMLQWAGACGRGRCLPGAAPQLLSRLGAGRDVQVQKIFNGYLRITNENFLDAYENSSSPEFLNLARKVTEAVSSLPGYGTRSHQYWGLRWEGPSLCLPCHESCPLPQLKLLYMEVPVLGPYYRKSAVTAFRWVSGTSG